MAARADLLGFALVYMRIVLIQRSIRQEYLYPTFIFSPLLYGIITKLCSKQLEQDWNRRYA